MSVDFEGGSAVVPTVSERDLRLETGAVGAVGAVLDSSDVVGSEVEGVVSVLVDVVALSWSSSALTATSAGSDFVVEPVDVESTVDLALEEAPDGVDDEAELYVPVLGLSVDELVDGARLSDPAEVASEEDAPDGSAHAIP